ncbi:LysR substrate-binding domain-containing protein [Agrobacterium tumefaciens]|uniref:LysR family transcriptional regulator, glycine cleavage system transcriptional activator n=1 Tax=Agrobacterium tumefaciens TaxID=358 RepID=A0A2L2LL82_AGRTU|nr:LysR substrate-binding domain-containing protein [Agrobacterium tumefaciens]AVH44988.1 LysR family transcriptional regulator, glycine cleavage system transcriptional activator [Agrobacterium tumefaciens]NSY98881.1 LysR family transcriptional regulator [Agrobacterium tumefaciens]
MKNLRNLPLPTLRTFEASARHGSLTKAADELSLTDSAVSHQIRRLEEALGYELFVKSGRGLVLTDAGRVLAKTLGRALQEIADTALQLADLKGGGGKLDIACPPMFANTWLAKNLGEFTKAFPLIECHISFVDNNRVPEVKETDIGIAFGNGGWPDRWSAALDQVTVAPVCTPELLKEIGGPAAQPTDLSKTLLLHWDDGSEWRRWFSESGLPEADQQARHLYCNDLGMAIGLAVHGAGVALVSDMLAADDLKRNTLVKPFPFSIDIFGAWHVLSTDRSLKRPAVRLFLRWLLPRFGRQHIPDIIS